MQEVRRLREAKDWGQKELAFHADLAQSVISEIETGKRDPNARTLRKLAEALGVEVRDLFPKGQSPLPFEALEAADDPAEWLEEHCGHAHLALRSAEELEAMVSGPNAEVNFKALQEEYAAVTKHMDPLMTLRLDPAARFMRAWAAYVLHQKRSGASEEEIGERTVEMAANLAATGAA